MHPDAATDAETNGLAIASVVLGIVWLFGLGSLLAIGLGWKALREIRASAGVQGGRGIAVAGVVIGIVGLLSSGLLLAFVVASAHH